jgi:hypothetical protein
MTQKQIAERIAYLWKLRDKDPRYYCENRLGEEKEDLYAAADSKTMDMAREIYSGE